MDPDLPLIEALQAGDDSALNELINRHRDPLFGFVFRLVRNHAAAADVVQETFVRAYFSAPRFKPRAAVKTWLYAIALNLSRDHARRLAKTRLAFSLDEKSSGAQIHDEAPLASEVAGKHDEFARLQRAIDALPSKLREALVVFSLEGKSQIEAAEILGTTPKTVELRVYHARQKLRELLAAADRAENSLRDRGTPERLIP